jgi:hypothetical protein
MKNLGLTIFDTKYSIEYVYIWLRFSNIIIIEVWIKFLFYF